MVSWSGSTLIEVLAWCCPAPSHYPNQYWLTASKITRNKPASISHSNLDDVSIDTNLKKSIQKCFFIMTVTFAWGQCIHVSATNIISIVYPCLHSALANICLWFLCGNYQDIIIMVTPTLCACETVYSKIKFMQCQLTHWLLTLKRWSLAWSDM